MIAESFERIHRSNLVQTGVLPLQFLEGQSRESLGLTGEESFSIARVPVAVNTSEHVEVTAKASDGTTIKFAAKARIDTPQEAEYYRNGGILPYVLRQLIATSTAA